MGSRKLLIELISEVEDPLFIIDVDAMAEVLLKPISVKNLETIPCRSIALKIMMKRT
jgi:hypothetical protein